MQNIEPKFDPLALKSSDWPVMAWVNRMPGVVDLAIFSHLSRTALVRLQGGRVGHLDVGQQVTHVLSGDEARRGCSGEQVVGQVEQAAVEQEQRPATRPFQEQRDQERISSGRDPEPGG